MDFRVVHPIPLTVADVMAEFHVLDALGHGQRGGSDRPSNLALASAKSQPRRDLEASLKGDGALNICPVPGAARILDLATDSFQRGRECLDVRGAQVSVFRYLCDGHRRLTGRPGRKGLGTAAWCVTSDLLGGFYAQETRIGASM
jgi:hypothetical protein